MNNPVDISYGPQRMVAWGIAGLGLAALLGAVLTPDPGGKFFLGLTTGVLTAVALGDLIFSPRLRVNAAGLVICSPTLRRQVTWASVTLARVDEGTHLGLRNAALELEFDDRLVVFSRRALGADPAEVLAVLRGFGAPTPE